MNTRLDLFFIMLFQLTCLFSWSSESSLYKLRNLYDFCIIIQILSMGSLYLYVNILNGELNWPYEREAFQEFVMHIRVAQV